MATVKQCSNKGSAEQPDTERSQSNALIKLKRVTTKFFAFYATIRTARRWRWRSAQMSMRHVFLGSSHIDNGCLVGAWYIRSRNDEWSSTIRWINFRR